MKRRFGGLFGACLLLFLACGSTRHVKAWSSASSDPSCDGSTIVLELEEQDAAEAAAAAASSMPTSTSSKGRRTFYSLPSPFGPWPLPANASAAKPMRLLVAEPIDACKPLAVVAGGGNSSSSSSSFALLVARGGGCSFLEKVRRAKEAGAEGVVVFNAGAQGCILLGVGNSSNSSSSSSAGAAAPSREELEALPLTVSVDAATGARLLAAASDAASSSASSASASSASASSASASSASASATTLLRIFEPVPSGVVDGSALVLGSLAVSGLLIGALLASRDEVKRRTGRRRRTLEGNDASASADGEAEEEEDDDDEDEPLAFSSLSDVVFVVALMASALLAAFFFPRAFSFILSALFVFGAGEATGSAASLFFARVFPSMRAKEVALPSLPAVLWGSKGSSSGGGEREREEEGMEEARNEPAPTTATRTTVVPAATLAGFALVALPAVLAWLLLGPRRVWPLHDLLALALVSSIPCALRLPSLRACAALLLLAACNDVFFVFGTPRLFPGTRSPMVSVATATPALVLLSPLQRGGPSAGFALLGFGDVVIPGACVAFAARWDALRRLRKDAAAAAAASPSSSPSSSLVACCCFSATLWASVAGYALGLCLTYFALYHRLGGSAGQPALLFLSPCVLLATSAALFLRGGGGSGERGGELRAAWRGLDSGRSSKGEEGTSRRRRGGDSENSSLLAA